MNAEFCVMGSSRLQFSFMGLTATMDYEFIIYYIRYV